MPLNDSEAMKATTRQPELNLEAAQNESAQEEIVTPIEAEIEEEVEREFERPSAQKKAIISVNGEDIGEVPITTHDRAA